MPIENHVSSDLFSQFGVTRHSSQYCHDDKIYHYRIVKRSRTREGFTVEHIAPSPVSYARMKNRVHFVWLYFCLHTKCASPFQSFFEDEDNIKNI